MNIGDVVYFRGDKSYKKYKITEKDYSEDTGFYYMVICIDDNIYTGYYPRNCLINIKELREDKLKRILCQKH